MQPNRVRTFESPTTYQFSLGNEYSSKSTIKWKQIADVNNGRLRPNSPCISKSATCSPVYSPAAPWLGSGAYPGALFVPLPSLADYVIAICRDQVSEFEASAYKAIQNSTNKLSGEFSSLNFLYELREVGSLLVDIDGKIRALSSYRPIDYLFGVAPLISDARAALQQYDSVAKSANARLKRFKSFPINRRFMGEVTRQGMVTFSSGNGHYQDDGINVVTRVKGVISCGIPWLAQIDPGAFALLDALAIDPSAYNAYNAIPFSWALDWIFPMGDFLQSLPSAMRPEFFFKGTISTKLRGFHKTETRYTGPSYYFRDGDAGSSFATEIYSRLPFNGPTTGLTKWDFAGGINSLSRSLIARDIFYQKRNPRGKERLFDRLNK